MHILIMRNKSNEHTRDAALLLTTFLSSQGVEVVSLDSSSLANDTVRAQTAAALPPVLDMAVVLGGDGTILQTAHLLDGRTTPILGLRFGHLGFLANAGEESIISTVADALAGDVVEERRALLEAEVVCEGDEDPYGNPLEPAEDILEESDGISFMLQDGTTLSEHNLAETSGVIAAGLEGKRRFSALNEVVLSRGAMGRIVNFDVTISGTEIASMRGDGVIVATATGSTAYALSAGGPLVSPHYRGLVVVPLAPHTLRSRSIVTGENDIVEITLTTEERYREATLFIDGEVLVFDAPIRRLYVKRCGEVTLLRTRGDTFYERASEVFF